MNNHVLVTGANGFIGQHFAKFLLQQNLKVRILVRSKANLSFFPENIEIVVGDLTDPKSLVGVCDQVDTIFHLGGYAHAWKEGASSFSDRHHLINYQGTKNLFNEASRSRVKKFIFFSSVKAVADRDELIDHSWNEAPNSPYGIAKREAENFILTEKNKYAMHVCVLRLSLVYGPAWKGNLANMLRAIDRGFFPPLPNIINRRSMISINDVCRAAMLVAENEKANGKIYFITDGIPYSTRHLYEMMCLALGKHIPRWHIPFWIFKLLAWIGDAVYRLLGRRLPFNSEVMTKLFGFAYYDSTFIEKDLDFKPNDDFNKILPEIVAAYKKLDFIAV